MTHDLGFQDFYFTTADQMFLPHEMFSTQNEPALMVAPCLKIHY